MTCAVCFMCFMFYSFLASTVGLEGTVIGDKPRSWGYSVDVCYCAREATDVQARIARWGRKRGSPAQSLTPSYSRRTGNCGTADDIARQRTSHGQGHFTLRRQTGIDSRGGEHRTGSGRLVPCLERTGRCRGADQGVLTDLGLVRGQREMALRTRAIRVDGAETP